MPNISEQYRKLRGDILYHYTPIENISSIEYHNFLYSQAILRDKRIQTTHMTSNLSRQIDITKGNDNYVILIFSEYHPFTHMKSKEQNLALIKIDISVLDLPGVLISDRVALDKNSIKYTPYVALEQLNIELCNNRYIQNKDVRERVKKYEILIPNGIDLTKYLR